MNQSSLLNKIIFLLRVCTALVLAGCSNTPTASSSNEAIPQIEMWEIKSSPNGGVVGFRIPQSLKDSDAVVQVSQELERLAHCKEMVHIEGQERKEKATTGYVPVSLYNTSVIVPFENKQDWTELSYRCVSKKEFKKLQTIQSKKPTK